MNELYNRIIEVDDRKYRYDPDYDCYYRVQEWPETHMNRWGWRYLCAVCLAASFIGVYLGY